MNVAILGVEQPSQVVANVIEQNYNLWLEQRLGEKINVVAFVTGGGEWRQYAKYWQRTNFKSRTIRPALSQKVNRQNYFNS